MNIYLRIFDDLVMQLKRFFCEAGYSKAVLGLSGGFDSALVAAVACEALGKENVLAVYLPMEGISSSESYQLARNVAASLGCEYRTIPIKAVVRETLFAVEHFTRFQRLQTFDGEVPRTDGVDVTVENAQARARGMLLMTLANQENRLVLETSNLSESLVGYCTLYGDTVGAVEVIGCLFKTEAYAVARAYNEAYPNRAIPQEVIDRPPSAELRVGQVDTSELPPYAVLDTVLYMIYFQGMPRNDFIDRPPEGWSAQDAAELYDKTVALMKRGTFKMKQCPPMLDVRDLPGRPSSVR